MISVVVLARDLYPDKWSGEDESTGPVTTRSVATTVGIMNVVGSLFGAMPMCHGAGGLAGQHLFGARTNGSVFMLGGAKMLVAVAFGAPLIVLIEGYPRPILGVLLLLAGVELAKAAGSIGRAPEFRIALLTGAAVMVLGALWGVILGLAAAWTWTLANRRASSEEG